MATNHTGESVSGDNQRTLPTPFLTKTYQLVDDPELDDLISWNDDGSAFIVRRPAEVATDLLPKYFKHNNFSSFVRQLNTYGFRKVVPDRWEFAHDCFRKGEKSLLREIQRRKISSATSPATTTAVVVAVFPGNSGEEQVISSNSSPATVPATVLTRHISCTAAPEVLEENSRLRKENSQLNRELAQLRGLCNNIVALMSSYATAGVQLDSGPLELFAAARRAPAEESGANSSDDVTAKLFGVSIGTKRVRREEEEQRREMEIKSEPLDENESPDGNGQDGASWLELGKREREVTHSKRTSHVRAPCVL